MCVSAGLVVPGGASEDPLSCSGDSTGADCAGGVTDAGDPSPGGDGEPLKLRYS
jgi:hypothetical protein